MNSSNSRDDQANNVSEQKYKPLLLIFDECRVVKTCKSRLKEAIPCLLKKAFFETSFMSRACPGELQNVHE